MQEESSMAKFVYVYTGGQSAATPQEQEQQMQAWGAWFGTLGKRSAQLLNREQSMQTVISTRAPRQT